MTILVVILVMIGDPPMNAEPGAPDPDQGPPTRPNGAPPPPGYGAAPPPPYGAAPPPAYGAPPPHAPPTSDETLWAVLGHVSFFVIPLIGPLIVILIKGNESRFVRDQAAEALNFHLTLLIASVVLALTLIGLPLLLLVAFWGAVFTVVAAVRSSRGEAYRYPATLRLVK